ncbi:uncharacterized protein Z518_04171 [Rhinocladiella mackenziei CBS 650.93]|uniref:Uncharacterized protein n=1 Tax=Rhinocladiella mackenziei CBS 650.93 TaxID=1442369 RepID=A0A0D2FVK1_9EURO|nr:uncharacterized protein Z518_04171 [Rhinocladiella mackenziei CBS 650.93]KIX06197.1 hypothetical protein Z518_04171 [Rhinocladiella mackenziei CBS 650.93]
MEAYDVGLYGDDKKIPYWGWKALFDAGWDGERRKEAANDEPPRGVKHDRDEGDHNDDEEDDIGENADHGEDSDEDQGKRKFAKRQDSKETRHMGCSCEEKEGDTILGVPLEIFVPVFQEVRLS